MDTFLLLMHTGQLILLEDGVLKTEVEQVDAASGTVTVKVLNGHKLTEHALVHIPGEGRWLPLLVLDACSGLIWLSC